MSPMQPARAGFGFGAASADRPGHWGIQRELVSMHGGSTQWQRKEENMKLCRLLLAVLVVTALTAVGPYPDTCASFDQLGFRVPLMVVSPFAKQHYVLHTVADHTSLLASSRSGF